MTAIQQTISPIDGAVIVERALATEKDIDTTLAKATQSQSTWQQTTLAQRATLLKKAVNYFVQDTEKIAKEITEQMGRPLNDTPGEIKGFQERALAMIEMAPEALAPIKPLEKSGFNRFITHEPLGTVVVIAPWNYPYLTAVNAIIPALMAGNTVILKHSKQTPLCAERLFSAFEQAGLPEGVFQYLHLNHDATALLIQDPRTHFVCFTGSVEAGHHIVSNLSTTFTGTSLELGGMDPAYIRQDANLDHTLPNCVEGAFYNAGQSCCGIERIYVHETLYDPFLEGFIALTKQLQLGNPLDLTTTLGPMVNTKAADHTRTRIKATLDAGAKALIASEQDTTGQPYLPPQILIDVPHNHPALQQEWFAPVVTITPVKNDEEAIIKMNDNPYGLTASIWTQDETAALRIGKQIQTGTVFMNRCDYLDPTLAWTGVKNTGRGCSLSTLGYLQLTRPKSFHFKQ